MYRIETIDGWIKAKPLLLPMMNSIEFVNKQPITDICSDIEDYLLNTPEDIFIGVWIEDKTIVAYTIFMKRDRLCCVTQLWCKPRYLFKVLDYIPTLKAFADGDEIYMDSVREASNRLLKRFKFKRKYIRYELEDNHNG